MGGQKTGEARRRGSGVIRAKSLSTAYLISALTWDSIYKLGVTGMSDEEHSRVVITIDQNRQHPYSQALWLAVSKVKSYLNQHGGQHWHWWLLSRLCMSQEYSGNGMTKDHTGVKPD